MSHAREKVLYTRGQDGFRLEANCPYLETGCAFRLDSIETLTFNVTTTAYLDEERGKVAHDARTKLCKTGSTEVKGRRRRRRYSFEKLWSNTLNSRLCCNIQMFKRFEARKWNKLALAGRVMRCAVYLFLLSLFRWTKLENFYPSNDRWNSRF